MQQLFDLDHVAGKTVLGAVEHDGEAIFAFTDKTFILLKARNGYDGCSADLLIKDDLDDRDWPDEDLIRLGIFTAEQLEALVAQRKAKWRAAEQEQERAEYERLRAKFEGGGK